MEDNIPTDLIIRYLSKEATNEEAEKLLDWVAADRSNQITFNEWTEAWRRQFTQPVQFDLAKGLKKVNDRIDKHEAEIRIKHRSFSWVQMAASFSLLVAAALWLVFFRPNSGSDTIQYTEYKTSGMIKSIVLPDGSRVMLNKNTSLKHPVKFHDTKREIILLGEAFFEVKKDSLRPFIVQVGELTTQVIGTSFNIEALQEKITVAVATGKVKVSQGGESLFLLPEEKATYTKSLRSIKKEKAELTSALAWRNPSLIFNDTPLSVVVSQLEEQYGIPITFEEESLKHCLITGQFKNHSLEKVLTAIGFSLEIKYRRSDNKLQLFGKGCHQ
jgi:ferric-dicitrate binding protein FerR (iron transport regulator)